jgi:hypothetical protein
MSISLQHFATVKAAVPQLVQCRHCGTEFVYEMKRTGLGYTESGVVFGEEDARRQATEAARRQLAEKLSRPDACDPVPCPECLRYQPYMRAVAGRRKYGQLLPVGIFFLVTAGVLGGLAALLSNIPGNDPGRANALQITTGGAAIAAALGVVILVARAYLARRYDPDKQSERKRQELAEARSMSFEKFQGTQARRTRTAFEEFTRQRERGKSRTPWPAKAEPFVIDLWLRPTAIINGGPVTVTLPTGERTDIRLREEVRPGDVYEVDSFASASGPFAVRILAIGVHPEEDAGTADA